MSDVVIRAEGLAKRYRIGQRERYRALRDVLAAAVRAPARLLRGARNGSRAATDHIWALDDVSFDVRAGEAVGLIGRNGAGKTTLLKILARVTRPTCGRAEVCGRLGSLLEVGTGFHPELTGRENTYLSGAILGMSKREIDRKFDEIVAFAEVQSFIDTPLKHYSSGMEMRLAFAVAAHLEPEILLLDEVLAVGDLAFQRKCLGKMSEVAQGGRTILFVSHQMNQVRRLCDRVLWIDAGRIRDEGATGQVVAKYESAGLQHDHTVADRSRCFLRWSVCGQSNVLRDGLRDVTFHFHICLNEPISQGHFGLAILADSGAVLVGWGFDDVNMNAGRQEIVLRLPALPLRPGAYAITCSMFNRGNNLTGGHLIEQWYALPPLIVDSRPLSHPQDRWAGVMNIPAEMQVLPG